MAFVTSESMPQSQLDSLTIIERVCSSLSLAGCVVTIATFASSSKFRKPINRLVFYASFGNMATNVATLMARAYTGSPNSGPCQFQAFLIQMFMPADAYWTLAMAINVHLTFYRHFDTHKLRRMEIPYIITCYGVPFVPALVLLLLRGHNGSRPYGNANLWCWITPQWDVYRIALFYAPVWAVSLLTVAIYCRAGKKIFKIRKQLQNFQSSGHDTDPGTATLKTTEISVLSEARTVSVPPAIAQLQEYRISAAPAEYSVSASAAPVSPLAESSTNAAHPHLEAVATEPAPALATSSKTEHEHRHPYLHLHNLHMPHHLHLPHMPHLSQLAHLAHLEHHIHMRTRRQSLAERRQSHALNRAAWSYTKCAMLFFVSMLVTWIPSSANRLYSYAHHERSSDVLEYMSAFVLPLQGFWNFTIYAVFSWDAFKDVARDALDRIVTNPKSEAVQHQQKQPVRSAMTTVVSSAAAFAPRKPSDSTNGTRLDDEDVIEPSSHV